MVRNAGKNTWLFVSLWVSFLFFITCKLELGESPIGPPIDTGEDADTSYSFDLSSSRSQLKADNIDSAIITAILRNSRGSAIVGDMITFTTNNVGVIIGANAVTDSTGKATALLRSTQFNDTCIVIAVSQKTRNRDTVRIIFSGVKISLQSNAASLKVNSFATVTADLVDGSNNPIGGDELTFTVKGGTFGDNSTSYKTSIDPEGQATVRVTAQKAGTVQVYASLPYRKLMDSISITFDSTSGPVTVSRQFRLYSSRSQLKADNNDTATITAQLLDENNNPAAGDTVFFKTNIGSIPGRAIIDSSGRARVTLRSTPINGVCIVRATSSTSKDTASTSLIFSGVKLRLETDVGDLKINENATITAFLTDGSGNPIGGDTVIFTAKGGVFSNNAAGFTTLLDPTGQIAVKVTSRSAGAAKIYASAANSSDSISVIFTNNALILVASKTNLSVGGNDEAQLTATYVNGSNQPMANVPITFSSNAGTITVASTTTNASGKAYSSIKSAAFAGTATIVASTSAGNAVIKVNFVSAPAKNIKLTISPDNIGVNGGIAMLKAVVTDSNSNMVSGSEVNFKILKGPGGGEYIDKPLVTTQNGIAHAQLFAGSVPSQYRGCLLTASVGPIVDTAKLTISGEPYAITVSRPQSDTVTVENAGQMDESTFDFNVGAVVVDINGNPVANGTKVNFSAVVSGMAVHRKYFIKWKGLGGTAEEVSAVCGYGVKDVPFEDINNNYRMDDGIDLKLDFDNTVASRGDDVNMDSVCDFNPKSHDLWYDFNANNTVDFGSTRIPITEQRPILRERPDTLCKDTIIRTLVRTVPDTLWIDTVMVVCHEIVVFDTIGFKTDTVGYSLEFTGAEPSIIIAGVRIWADLYPNGVWDTTELVRDVGTKNFYDVPASGDRLWYELESLPYWFGERFEFLKNDFGIAVTTSASTVNGVAYAKLTYPRQLARRLIATVNAEANGVRDRDGERFILPVIVGN
jgi:hypothetical protein